MIYCFYDYVGFNFKIKNKRYNYIVDIIFYIWVFVNY